MIPRGLPLVFIAFAAFCACSSSTTANNSDAGSGGGGDGGAGNACYNVTLSTVNGSTGCGPVTCNPNQYCFSSTGECNQGCASVSNCASGQYCDLSNAQNDLNGNPFGSCQTPTSANQTPCKDAGGGGSCPDVHGAYNVVLDTASSSPGCSNGFSNTTCTVTEASCTLSWSCTPNNGFQTSTVDGNGDSTVTVPAPGGGGNATCALVFSSGAFTFDCQFTGGGAAVDCKGNGTEN